MPSAESVPAAVVAKASEEVEEEERRKVAAKLAEEKLGSGVERGA